MPSMHRLKLFGLAVAAILWLSLVPVVGLAQAGRHARAVPGESKSELFKGLNPERSAFFVAPSATGLLDGYVTAADGSAPLEANVAASDGSWTATDPATGYYSLVLDAGTYDITAEATGYAGQTVQVTVPEGEILRQNFSLVTALVVAPDPVSLTLPWFGSGGVGAVITNNLDVDYPFEFLEAHAPENNGTRLQVPGILLLGDDVADDTTGWQTYRDALSAAGTSWDEWNLDHAPFPTAADLAAYSILVVFDESTLAYEDAECQILADWLTSGGRAIFATSMDWLRDLENGTPGAGEHNLYLLFETAYADSAAGSGITDMEGVPGDLVSSGFAPPHTLSLAGTSESGGDYASPFQGVATAGLFYGAGGIGSGLAGLTHYENGSYRTVWLGANFHNGLTDQAQRNDLMKGILSFLAGVDVPWYGTSIVSGTVPAGGSLDWTHVFSATPEAGIDQPGEYRAVLRIRPVLYASSLPGGEALGIVADSLPARDLDVVLTVVPSDVTGKLEGFVTGDRPGGPLAAEILVETPQGLTWTVATDPTTGHYAYWLEQGFYDVTASADGYLPETVGAEITPGQTTIQDMELALLAPEIEISPPHMVEILQTGGMAVHTLYLSNTGLLPLNFQLGEWDLGFVPAGNGVWGMQGARVLYDDSHGGSPDFYSDLFAGLAARGATVEVLSNGPLDAALLAGYDVLWVPDALDAPFARDELDDVEDWVHGGGGLFINFDCCDEDSAPALAARFDIEYMGLTAGNGGVTVNIYPHPTTEGVSSVHLPDPYQYLSVAGTAGIVVADVTGKGQVAVNEVGGRVVVVGDDAFDDGTYDDNDNALLAMNIFDWLAGGDAPWLHQYPVSGTVPVSDAVSVQVAFDAGALDQTGTYRAGLRVRSDDPYNQVAGVPVTLTAVSSADLGWLAGTLTGTGYCDGEGYPLEAGILAESSVGVTWPATSDGTTGAYARWLPAGAYTVTASAPEHTASWATVQITAGQTTTQDLALRYLAPCLGVSPQAFTVTIPAGTQQVEWLSIANYGAGDLAWALQEDTGSEGDALWVSEMPTQGLVMGDDAAGVQVTFDSAAPGVVAGECYTANLDVIHDDPGQGSPVRVPLRLCVATCTKVTAVTPSVLTPLPAMGIIAAFEADISPAGTTAPYHYRVDHGDGMLPLTGSSDAEPFVWHHTYALPGSYTLRIEVWNCGMDEPVAGMVTFRIGRGGYGRYLPLIVKEK